MNNNQKPMNIEANPKKYRLQAHTYLKRELGMDDGQTIHILNTLSAPLKTSFEAVEQAYEAHDLKMLTETAHSLKGALSNIGLNELAELAKMIEESSARGESIIDTKQLVYLNNALLHIMGGVVA